MPAKKPPVRRVRKAPAKRVKRDYILEVQEDIIEINRLRTEMSKMKDEVAERQARVVDAFAKADQSSAKIEVEGKQYNVAYVESTSVVLDEEKLKKKLGATLWNKVTTRVLDKKKLEAFIASNEIRTSDVAACSNEVPRAPHVKITAK